MPTRVIKWKVLSSLEGYEKCSFSFLNIPCDPGLTEKASK